LAKKLPSAFNFSIEQNFKPKFAWLQRRLMLDVKSLSLLVERTPSLLGSTVETNMEPAIRVDEECVEFDARRTLVANSPRLLTSSLEKWLKPRLAECIDAGTVQRTAMTTTEKWSIRMALQKTKLLKQHHQQLFCKIGSDLS
jgi:hypothetical protein